MDMIIRQLNPHACRTYLLGAEGAAEVVLVDPVLEHVSDYLALLEREHLTLTHVLDTHTHADHISGAAALRDETGCEYVMHTRAPVRCVSVRVADGFSGTLGPVPLQVVHTPGHTKDSVTLVLPDAVLTGDVLFLDDGGAGRDDLPGGDPDEHWESLQRLLTLPEHMIVYPAHEYRNRPPSSLGQQKRRNPVLQLRTKDEYMRYVEELRLGPAEWMKAVLKANYACARDPKAAWIPVDVPACEVKGTLALGVNDQQVATVPVAELKRRLDAGQAPILVDVREAHELREELGLLPGIRHIPVGSLSSRLAELDPIRDREIVTICRAGGRATTAAQILQQAGFTHVRSLEGGMTGWRMAGYPVATEDQPSLARIAPAR
jgi:glyoxylase-like metal-dependent hydrolase (beta-lactamase superfamily II)/rhodanese-related sulfurtransferase